MEKNFTHLDNEGNAKMVNVGNKPIQKRIARAKGTIYLNSFTIEKIKSLEIKKGDVFTVAKIAGIQAAKQTANLIPLCHTLTINYVDVDFKVFESQIDVEVTVECDAKTGAEMEALTAVSVTLLTIYDMCKAIDKDMKISNIHLLEKINKDVL